MLAAGVDYEIGGFRACILQVIHVRGMSDKCCVAGQLSVQFFGYGSNRGIDVEAAYCPYVKSRIVKHQGRQDADPTTHYPYVIELPACMDSQHVACPLFGGDLFVIECIVNWCMWKLCYRLRECQDEIGSGELCYAAQQIENIVFVKVAVGQSNHHHEIAHDFLWYGR